MATVASIDIVRSDGEASRKMLWSVAVWGLPIVGVLLWRWRDKQCSNSASRLSLVSPEGPPRDL
ncbi:PLD nuclease N-terminal domain-containing protein [Prescottella sp. R16]|uniref:PLD nuclease N-terminal domain-containing protein n=1 Tax=Prescottella sp. R16 TaxID=3064529 RepID=UPI00351D315A